MKRSNGKMGIIDRNVNKAMRLKLANQRLPFHLKISLVLWVAWTICIFPFNKAIQATAKRGG